MIEAPSLDQQLAQLAIDQEKLAKDQAFLEKITKGRELQYARKMNEFYVWEAEMKRKAELADEKLGTIDAIRISLDSLADKLRKLP
jgi:hypothetical protein